MNYDLLSQVGTSLYEWTSFRFGEFSLADFALTAHDAFLNSTFVFYLQIISALITLGLLIAALRLSARRKEFDQKAASHAAVVADAAAAGPLQDQWDDILRHTESVREGEWKFAVIEADTILDSVLKNYFPGDTMGERLMNIDKTKLLSIDGVWEAHKIRNRLAHDTNYFLRHAEALRAIRFYEAALKELGAIQ